MSEVNKVSSNSSFDARINASTDSKPQRDSTVQEDGKQSSTKDSAPKPSPQSKQQERQDSAVTEMIKALQQEQQVEDVLNYRQNIQELYRQRNQQASEEYMERLKQVQEKQGETVLEERKEVKDVHHKYNERVQDLSRKHLQRMLKSKLEDSTFRDLTKAVDPEGDEGQTKPDISAQAAKHKGVLDKSRLRPEVSRLLQSQAGEKSPADTPPKAPGTPLPGNDPTAETSENTPNYKLMESALHKLRQRLGGAHQDTDKGFKQAQQLQQNDQIYAQRQPLHHSEAPVRANMGQIQQDIQRARLLQSAADGSRYVPLESRDIEQLLTRYKVPFNHAMVHTIKQTAHKLQDSSFFFLQSATLLAQIGLAVTPERAEIVRESLRLFARYERPSILNKLYRYLISTQYLEVHQRHKAEQAENQGRVYDLEQSLFDPKTGQPRPESTRPQAQTLRFRDTSSTQNGPQGLQLPAGADDESLRNAVKAQLKDLGLPSNRVMVRQIVHSAEGDVQRAQALLLQLASGGSLAQAAVEKVYQGLLQLTPEQQNQGPLTLMKLLNIHIPESLKQSQNPEQQKLSVFLRQLGLPMSRLDGHPEVREALAQLQSLGEKTQSSPALTAQLAQAITTRPDFWFKQLRLHHQRLQSLIQPLSERFATPAQQKELTNAMILALEMPESRLRSWERAKRVLGELSTTPVQTASPETAEIKPKLSPEDILAKYGNLPFKALGRLRLQNQAKEALLLLHQSAQDLGDEAFIQRLMQNLQQAPQLSRLQQLVKQLPSLQAQLAQGIDSKALHHLLQQLEPQGRNGSPEDLEILKQYPLFEQEHPGLDARILSAAKESLLILHRHSEAAGLSLKPVLAGQSLSTLPALLDYLAHQLPQLQIEILHHPLSQNSLQQYHNILSGFAQVNPTSALSQPALSAPQDSPFVQLLARFYPQLPSETHQHIAQTLQQAGPESLKGFFQLHQVLGQLDPSKAQSLGALWHSMSQPPEHNARRLMDRLSHLSKGLTPLLSEHTFKSLYTLSPAQQNQWIQALQGYLQNGQKQPLKAVFTHTLSTPLQGGDPLHRVKEHLQAFQLPQPLSPELLGQVWQLSQGSRLRLDALGLLLKANMPLFEANIRQVALQLENLPLAQRTQQAPDLLLQLTGLQEGPGASLAQLQVHNPLTQLRTLLQSELPLLAQYFNPASTAQLPAHQIGISLHSSPNVLLEVIDQCMAGWSPEQRAVFQPIQQALHQVLQQLNGIIPGPATGAGQSLVSSPQALGQLQQAIQAFLKGFPEGAHPLNALLQQLEAAVPPQTTQPPLPDKLQAQLQTQLTGFLHELGLLNEALGKRLQHSSAFRSEAFTPPNAESLAQSLPADNNPSLEAIQKYLAQWGLQANSPEHLQQILQLMQGQQERLDAMAILLKGNMPLLPAHIQVVAQYVKNLPPHERFRSISKVLSFLSDALIAQMQSELQDTPAPLLNAHKAALHQGAPSLSDHSQATLALAQHFETSAPLPALEHVLHTPHPPQQFLLPLERIIGQLSSFFPRFEVPAALQQIQETLGQLQQTLQPDGTKSPALNQWLQQVGTQVQHWDRQLRQQVQALSQQQQVPFEDSSWIESLLRCLLGISDELANADPQKAAQLEKLKQNIQEQLQHFRHSLQSLDAGQQQLAEPLQYIPAYLSQWGLPVEILVHPEKDETHVQAGENFSEVLLNVKTHTLGDVQLQLRYDTRGQKLHARLGVHSGKLLQHIQPLLARFEQHMQHLPFSVSPLQTYVVSPEQHHHTVMARRLYQRLGQQAISGV